MRRESSLNRGYIDLIRQQPHFNSFLRFGLCDAILRAFTGFDENAKTFSGEK